MPRKESECSQEAKVSRQIDLNLQVNKYHAIVLHTSQLFLQNYLKMKEEIEFDCENELAQRE